MNQPYVGCVSGDFNAKAKISVDVDAGDIEALINSLGTLAEHFGDVDGAVERMQDSLVDASKRSSDAAKEAQASWEEAAEGIKRAQDGISGKETGDGGDNGAAAKAARDTAAALEEQQAAADRAADGLPRLRYALYDVAQTTGAMSAGITAAGGAALYAAGSFESSFTSVERTSGAMGAEADKLREQLLGLTREIPQTFGEITDLASRGAQLGIANDQIKDFTQTVAEFVATSDTVTLDQAVEAFGRISNLMGDTNFNKMGSAITLVGVNAAATEAQIVKTTQELAPFATAVGMSTDEVIALATAVASLGQPPERARSAFLTLQRVMDTAVSGGAENLQEFSRLLGITADEVANLWKQDPGQFTKVFVDALGNVDNLTGAFELLGIKERRAVQVFQALAADARNAGDGVSVLDQAFRDSAQGYEEGTELARQYALILDDLSSKWTIFLNAVAEAGAATGAALAPLAKVALDVITPIVQGLAQLAQSPVGKFLITLVGILGGVAAGLLAIVSAAAAGAAGLAAFGTASRELAKHTGVASLSLRNLNAAFYQVAAAAGISSRSINIFKGALIGTGIGAVLVLLGSIAAGFTQTGDAAEAAFDKYIGTTEGLAEAMAADHEAYTAAVKAGNQDLIDSFTMIDPAVSGATESVDDNREALATAASVLGATAPKYSDAANEVDTLTVALGENTLGWARNAFMASEEFQKLMSDQSFVDAWRAIGADFDTVMQIAAVDGQQGVVNYFTALAQAADGGGGALLEGFALFGRRVWETCKAIWNNITGFFRDVGSAIGSFDFGALWGAPMRSMMNLSRDLVGVWNTPQLQSGFLETANAAAGLANQLNTVGSGARSAGEAMDDFGDSGSSAGDKAKKGADKAKKAVEDLEKKVRTLKDYASDLGGVWDRAFEIRFSAQTTLDAITAQWNKMRKEIVDARQAIAEYRAEMATLSADRDTLTYWLGVAENYGDELRANELRAKIAETDAKLADTKAKLTEEQEKNNKGLKGNSDAAIDNRSTLAGLVKAYQDHLQALAASGMGSRELERETAKLKRQFIQQATQLGFSKTEVDKYARAFDDMSAIIKRVPRNVTIDIKTPSLTALDEYFAQLEKKNRDAGKRAGDAFKDGYGSGINGGGGGGIGGGGGGGGLPGVVEPPMDDAWKRAEAKSTEGGKKSGETGRTNFFQRLTFGLSLGAATIWEHLWGQTGQQAKKGGEAAGQNGMMNFLGRLSMGFVHGVEQFKRFWSNSAGHSKSGGVAAGRAGGASFSSSLNQSANASGVMNSFGRARPGIVASARWSGFSAGASWMGAFMSAINFSSLLARIPSSSSAASRASGSGRNSLRGGGRAHGGYAGNGATKQAMGEYHGREFIMSAPATANIGVDTLTRMHNIAKVGGNPFAGMGDGGGVREVELSPFDRQLLRDIADSMGLSIRGDALTAAATAGAVNAGRTGRG